MDPIELVRIRVQDRQYPIRCSGCGTTLANCRIDLIVRQGNRSRVRTTCAFCNDENVLQVVLQVVLQADAGAMGV
jgi:coenzyme F420-reducing hydrogenase beta subunit